MRASTSRNTVLPGIEATITRNYGETAAEKAPEADPEAAFATGSVIPLVGLALGRREAVIVGAAVILTLTATLFASWAWGFTLNRVSLFALIFSIGILVDDAIVVVENIHRHQQLHPGKPLLARSSPARWTRSAARPSSPRFTVIARCCRWPSSGADGAVHEPHPDQRQPMGMFIAGDRLRRHALAGAPG